MSEQINSIQSRRLLVKHKNNIDAIDAFKVALQIDDKFTEAWIKSACPSR